MLANKNSYPAPQRSREWRLDTQYQHLLAQSWSISLIPQDMSDATLGRRGVVQVMNSTHSVQLVIVYMIELPRPWNGIHMAEARYRL